MNSLYECSLYSYTETIENLRSELIKLNFREKLLNVSRVYYSKEKSIFVHDRNKNVLTEKTGPIQDRNRLITAYKTINSQIFQGDVQGFLIDLDYQLEKEIKQEVFQFLRGNIEIEIHKTCNDSQQDLYICQAKIITDDLIGGEEALKNFKEEIEEILQFIKI